MSVGETARLQAAPADGSGQPFTGLFAIAWASSAPSKVGVTQDGVLSAVANGIATVTATATRLDTGASAMASVVVTVGSAPSDTVAPSVPTGLTAMAASSAQVNLTWAASTDNVAVTGYRVFRSGTQIATVTTTSYAVNGLTASTNYQFTVAATDAAGNISAQSASASATTLSATATTPGLLASYSFSQGSGTSLLDDSGHGVIGSFANGPTWGAGKNGGGLAFNGTSAYVGAGDISAIDALSRLTVSAWVKTTATGEKHIVDKSMCDGAANGGPFEFGTGFFTAGRATLLLYKANAAPSFVYAESSVAVADGTWHFIAGVYDGASVLVYVDGTLSGTTAASGLVMPATSNAFELGGHCNGNAYPWSGSVDDVRVYNRALTSAEVTADMNTAVATSASTSADAGTGGAAVDAGAGKPSYSLNFATAAIENPLWAGGVWSNNTQGVGGNVAPGNMTSMRVDLASDGVTRIAFDTHGGAAYDDSFAFVPGFGGDQYIEAVIYKEPGYDVNTAGGNHEIELILGCSSASGSRIWNEFLVNSGGGVDIVYLNGGPSDFQSIGNVDGTIGTRVPVDGDTLRATRVGTVLSLYLNGGLWRRYDGSNSALVAKGSGIGIAGFIRPGATHNKFGFRRVTMGSL